MRRGHHLDAGPRRQNVARCKVSEFDFAMRGLQFDRKQRIAHQLPYGFLHPAGGLQITGPETQPVSGHEGGHEKRKADQMIDMAVTQKQIDVGRFCFFGQFETEHAQSRSCVEDKAMVTAANLDA